jgi:hypothetical protein
VYVNYHSDDATTASNRPSITAYWTTAAAGGATPARRRKIMIGQIDSTIAICRYEQEIER